MGVAKLSGMRSKDPNTQVGCCIATPDHRIASLGYNGLPRGCNDDLFPWQREGNNVLTTKYPFVVHAELNAILNHRGSSLKDCILYVSLFPCNECAKAIIQSGITEIVYELDLYANTDQVKASKQMLKAAGIKLRKYKLAHKQIVINI